MVWEKCWFFDFNWLTYLTKRSSSVWLDLTQYCRPRHRRHDCIQQTTQSLGYCPIQHRYQGCFHSHSQPRVKCGPSEYHIRLMTRWESGSLLINLTLGEPLQIFGKRRGWYVQKWHFDPKPAICLKRSGLDANWLQSVYRNSLTIYRLVTYLVT